MQPIVNGLDAEYTDQVVFEYQLADTAPGRDRMRAYELRGHPSYVLVAPNGEVHWAATGAVPADIVRQQIAQLVE
jgi:hypothetical protein